jgi:hypothetical protein
LLDGVGKGANIDNISARYIKVCVAALHHYKSLGYRIRILCIAFQTCFV